MSSLLSRDAQVGNLLDVIDDLKRRIAVLERTALTEGSAAAPLHTINVLDYGAVGDGVTDDTAAIQRACDAYFLYATEAGIQVYDTEIWFPSGRYFARGINLCNRKGIRWRGVGAYSSVIIESHATDKAAVEVIGTQDFTATNIQIEGDGTDTPAVGWFTGRSDLNLNSSHINFDRCRVSGEFATACWYNCGSESNVLRDCHTWITGGGCLAGVMYDYRHILGPDPDFATLDLTYDGALSKIEDCHLTASGGGDADEYIPIYIYAGNAPVIEHTYLVSWGGPLIYGRGGARGLNCDYLYNEGTFTHVLKITLDDDYNVPSNISDFSLFRTGGGGTSGYSIECEDDTIVRNSVIDICEFSQDIYFYRLESSKLLQWAGYTSIDNPVLHIVDLGFSVNNHIRINAGDDLDGTPYNSIVEYCKDLSGGGGSLVLGGNMWLRIGGLTSTPVKSYLSATANWDPGSLADGALAWTLVELTGVGNDATWVAWASFTSLVGDPSYLWVINAYPIGGYVSVTLENRSGSTIDLGSGTLLVVAMKVG